MLTSFSFRVYFQVPAVSFPGGGGGKILRYYKHILDEQLTVMAEQ